jgi:hypothetical protein
MPHLQDNAKPNEARSSSPVLRKIPSENGAFTAVNEEKPKLEESCKNCGCSETHATTSEDSETCESSNELTFPAMSFYGKRKSTVDEVLEKSKNIKQSEEVEKLYDKIDSWNFPIFDVWENGNVLRGVSFVIFLWPNLYLNIWVAWWVGGWVGGWMGHGWLGEWVCWSLGWSVGQ